MNSTVKNIVAVVVGLTLGSIVNMGIVMMSGFIIPPPEGGDVTTMEGLRQTMHLFEPKHFIFPFLAHALGTLFGALLATFIAATHKLKLALIIGVFFLIGGIVNTYMLPSPIWFTVIDLVSAYIPMAYLGSKIIQK